MKKKVYSGLVLLLMTGFFGCSIASASLVAQWNFNGNSNDVSGNGYNGTVYGATLTTDRFGNPNSAYSFDGVDDYIDIPGSESLNLTGGFVLDAWVRFTEYNWDNTIVGKHISDVGAGYILGVRNNKFIFYLNDGGPRTLDTPETYDDGQWHHVCGVYDGTTQSLFVDDMDIPKDYQTNVYTLYSPATVRIGGIFAGKSNGAFIGDIDEVKIIPEPCTLLLLGLGGLVLRKYRR